jgi:hypothetical protein
VLILLQVVREIPEMTEGSARMKSTRFAVSRSIRPSFSP